METLFGKALGDLASLLKESWFTGMGFVGLFLVAYVLLFGAAQDDFLVAAIAAAMMGIGFGEAETRSLRQELNRHDGVRFVATTKVRHLNNRSIALFAFGAVAACSAAGRAFFLML
ncbi:hypothetical protein QMT40_001812 [Parvibaculaceae bacterium PLY_AMNH_Bact1]|nr:hypothetical protein QMT40_001812 [Parvibaculaceae bacterium PLY_AMNH_Bact1]